MINKNDLLSKCKKETGEKLHIDRSDYEDDDLEDYAIDVEKFINFLIEEMNNNYNFWTKDINNEKNSNISR